VPEWYHCSANVCEWKKRRVGHPPSNNQTCKYGDPSALPPVAGYDDLARLISANCGTPWAQTFSYDSFGNLSKSGSSSFSPVYGYSGDPNKNQYIPYTGFTAAYDNNGNVAADPNNTYSWDADGRPITVDGVNLTYDALGRMVEQNSGSVYDEIAYTPTGAKLALMSGSTMVKAFIGLPAGAEAVYTSSGLAYYRHGDWLGSSRFASTTSRTMYSDTAYAPFGEHYATTGTTDLSFTGQNQDTASGEYDFPARELGEVSGRWPSPDPAGMAAVNPGDPQTWNRYAYVRNSPLNLTDPTGLIFNAVFRGTGGGGGMLDVFTGGSAGSGDETLQVTQYLYTEYEIPPGTPWIGPDGQWNAPSTDPSFIDLLAPDLSFNAFSNLGETVTITDTGTGQVYGSWTDPLSPLNFSGQSVYIPPPPAPASSPVYSLLQLNTDTTGPTSYPYSNCVTPGSCTPQIMVHGASAIHAPPITCGSIEDAGAVTAGAGGALFLGGSAADLTIVGLPEGVTAQGVGNVLMATGSVLAAAGVVCSWFR